MLCCASSFAGEHPSRHLIEAEPPPRHIRKGVLDFKDTIQQHTQQPLDRTTYRQALDAIHQESVNTFMDSLLVNGVLGEIPPPIADNELELPRETRVTLTQLRSGY
ncbi:unnamed protein product [Ceratitis capitata]|uniref:(Mediterranean fruit fly) hypothetical protein n=1 Tax=Ceratitis capitata TaxID=7213 RepID=A0A811V8Q9_CERCA|nr:unnamed protein product [Ceratitis capitata]